MARPIKETPVLEGKDAERFEKNVKENEHKKVSQEEYRKAETLYNRVMKASNLG